MILGLLGLFGSNLAVAHPVGRHVVQHDLDLTMDASTLAIRYETTVPPEIVRGRPSQAVVRELVVGLLVTVDGRTVSWAPSATRIDANDHGLGVVVDGTVPLPDGSPLDLAISNGNLPETRSVFRTTVTLDPRIRVADSSLFVLHEGALARSDEGRLLSSPGARRTTLTIDRPRTTLQAIHRAMQAGPLAPSLSARSARWTSPWTSNQSRPAWLALAFLGLVGVRLPRPQPDTMQRWAIPLGLVAIVIVDLGGPALLSGPLAVGAVMAALASLRVPAVAWLIVPSLAASTDLWGLAVLALAVQGTAYALSHRSEPPRAIPILAAIGATLGIAQLVRVLAFG